MVSSICGSWDPIYVCTQTSGQSADTQQRIGMAVTAEGRTLDSAYCSVTDSKALEA